MNQLAAMRMFDKITETLSFSIAARQLHVTTAVVTRAVALPESHFERAARQSHAAPRDLFEWD